MAKSTTTVFPDTLYRIGPNGSEDVRGVKCDTVLVSDQDECDAAVKAGFSATPPADPLADKAPE